MSTTRSFSLVNTNDQVFSLNGEDGIFLSEPSGLGITYDHTYYTKLMGFYGRSKASESQGVISGTLIFYQNENIVSTPYESYTKFIQFIERSDKLYMMYDPATDDGTYYACPVQLKTIEKGEYDHTYGYLSCSVQFVRMTMWYKRTTANQMTAPGTMSGFTLGSSGSPLAGSVALAEKDGGGYKATVSCSGTINGGVIIKYSGVGSDFSIRCIGKTTKKVHGICQFNVSLLAGESFTLSTIPGDKYLKMYSSSGVESSLLDYIDPSTTPFFSIPYTEECEIVINGDGMSPDEGSPTVQTYSYYRGA